MIRLGLHYIEPRRLGFFVLEQFAVWSGFLFCAGATARLMGHRPSLPMLLMQALLSTGLIEAGLYFTSLHQFRTALADAAMGQRLFRAIGAATLLAAACIALAPLESTEIAAAVVGLATSALLVIALRASFPSLVTRLGLRTRIFLIGEGRAARQLIREVARDGSVEIAGFAGPRTDAIATRSRNVGADTVVVAAEDRRGLPIEELLICRAEGLAVIDAASFSARALHRLPVELIRPSDLIFEDGFAQPLWLRLARRALSIASSLLLLALTAPILIVSAIAIRIDSRGSILFLQDRVGYRGRIFRIFKFRTMARDAELGGALWATRNDPRVTRVGRFLRRYRIDELPQLINVLRGDMNLVGPRPERPEFVEELRRHIPYYDLRTIVSPGITGWAQVSYPYAASVEEAREKLQYDLYYVRHLSLALDVYILLTTARVVLSGSGAR